MSEFKCIDPKELDLSGARLARKCARVRARKVHDDEEVSSEMRDGFRETHNTAMAGDYIVENPGGEEYVVHGEDFEKRYRSTGEPHMYKPISPPVKVLELEENVRFEAPWGEEMRIRAGGVLVIEDNGEIYGIQRHEFFDTYEYVD